MEPEQYCEWICKPNEWGGMPELRLLSQFYQVQITVVDIGNDDLVVFKGSDGKQSYQKEIFLMFDGSHYNLAIQGSKRIFETGSIRSVAS